MKIDYANSNNNLQKAYIAGRASILRGNNGQYKVEAEHTLDSYYIPDVTNEVNDMMYSNEQMFSEHYRDFYWFAQNVKTDSLVDVKNSVPDIFARPDYSYHIIYNGEIMRGDASGNIIYGYLGTASGFSEYELLSGAGLYQIYSDRKNPFDFFKGYYGDNIGDGEQIIYGISLYYQKQYPGCVYPFPVSQP